MKQSHKPAEKEGERKPKYNMWQNSWFMIKLAWREKEKKVLVLGMITALLAVATSLINLYISPLVLGCVERGDPVARLAVTILVFTGLLIVTSAASAYVSINIVFGRITVRSALIAAINRKAATTSYPNVGDERFRKLQSKSSEAVSSNDCATEAVWTTLTDLAKNVIGFAIYLALLSTLQPAVMIVILATTVLGYFVGKRINEYGYRHREEVEDYENKLWYTARTSQDAKAAKDIRIFNLKPWLNEVSDKAYNAYVAFHRRANGVYVWGSVVDLVLAFLRNGIAYAYLINLVLRDGLSASHFLLYFSAVGGFAGWVTGILGNLTTLHIQSLDLSVVREFLEYHEPFSLDDGKVIQPDPMGKYEIALENVSFKYPGSENYILKNVNLTLHPGEKLAVVGLNGAGKTTIVKLLCGFYDPTEGRVTLNGVDIREFRRRDYYKLFSAVFQSFSLLASSVAANVAQSEDDIDMQRVRECVTMASLTEKIESLPQGYETLLNRDVYEDAIMLSGGETQRLMLARALYKNAPIIMLDEPTAALDPIAEAALYEKYSVMTSGKSSVYISHRLASTRFCDRIVFIEDGKIAEQGTHSELLAKGGRYAELFEVQSRYYKEDGADSVNAEEVAGNV